MKLHLGCFNKKIPGFVNVDIREDVNPDVVDNIFELEKFQVNTASVIYSCHALEHLDRKSVPVALKRWYDVLQTGGKLYLAVPDMEAIFAHYFYWKDLKVIYSALGGSQRHEYDYHLSHFDFKTLKEILENVGFKDVKLYDRWKQEWLCGIDDYSAAYHPHMDFEKGKLLSLNVEATK
jgi:predicted SAM-dependent methyltransferase